MKVIAIFSAAAVTAAIAAGCSQIASSTQQTNNRPNAAQSNPESKTKPANKEAARISLAEAKIAFDSGKAVFVDTRDHDSYKAGHIKGAVNMSAGEVAARFGELPKDRQIIAYCS